MHQKAARITFWISTGVFCAMMAFSAFLYLTSPDVAQGFTHLGFPHYFRIELAVFKLAGACALLLPFVPRWLKEWSYAGFFITLISAFTAHVSSGDGPDKFIAPIIFAGILLASYISFRKWSSAGRRHLGQAHTRNDMPIQHAAV